MLLNWNTIDTCFLSRTFRVRSGGGFFAVCFCSFLLVVFLELLRRLQRNYDHRLRKRIAKREQRSSSKEPDDFGDSRQLIEGGITGNNSSGNVQESSHLGFLKEQTIRALIHMFQFTISYVIMLLVMYSNGKFCSFRSQCITSI